MNSLQGHYSRSVPAGGPATINGILYQLLWSLLRASRATIKSTSTDASGNFEEVFLALEPLGGGGDLVVTDQTGKIVEQLKARPDGGTWSLREVVEGVIPDLYLACSNTPENSKYRLVTEGRIGRWEGVYKFFQSLGRRTCPVDDPISDLDASTKVSFGGHTQPGDDKAFWSLDSYSEATLFELIVMEVRKRKDIRDREDETTTQRNLWSLLGNFEFVGGQEAFQLQREIDSHLLAFVDHHEQIPQIRDAMALDLARRATEGGTIEARAFFCDHGLDSVPLTDWSRLRANAAEQVDTYLSLRGYDADLDVRTSRAVAALDDWPSTTPILAVSGESGQGKSWRAYRMAIEARPLPQIVVAVDATGNAHSTLDRAAETLWQEIMGHDAVIPISQVAKRVRRVVGTRVQPWMLLVIDGVQELNEALELVRQPWDDWGVRVLLTCQPQISERIEQESRGRCIAVLVEDFDVDELHEYLSRCFGEDWPVIPDTIRSPLRRPLLANLYRQTAASPDWRPESEYELYAAFWKRLVAEAPLDGTLLERLVGALFEGGSYPWSGPQLTDAGINSESLKRIERSGWIHSLQEAAGPRFEVPHDRLLNWIVAATLADSLREKRETVQSVGDRLRDFFSDQGSVGNRYMGFVPMDFLWIAVQDNCLNEHIPVILAVLEHRSVRTEVLYRNLVPTLGTPIIDALIRRLKDVIGNGILSRTIANAIGLIGGAVAIDAARELLMANDPLLQRSAMRILTQCPVSDVLDRLWELHIVSQDTPDRYLREHESKHTLYKESYGALRECCRISPEWLDNAIQQSRTENEPTHTLADLVAAVGGNEGKAIWQKNKMILRQKVRQDKQRSLVACIGRFSDTEEIDWLAESVSRDKELIGPMALSALARLIPQVAIDRLDALPRKFLSSTRKWYVNQMFVREPDAMRSKILRMIQDSEDPWATAAIYCEFEHFLDSNTFDILLDNLETRLEEALAIEEWGTPEPLYSEMQLLASLGTTPQLDEFKKRKDSRLESMLVELLLRIGPRRGNSQDSPIRDNALEVLYRIGGAGFTQVVNSYLQCESRFGRMDAIRLAGKRPDADTILLLSGISQSNETWDGAYIEQCHAAERLADIGEWRPVLHLVERIGLKTLLEITDLPRHDRRPPVELIQEAKGRVTLKQSDSFPGDLLVVGMGGQKADAQLVRTILASCQPDGELVHACVIALELLRDESEESVALLANQLNHNEFSATNALIVNGTQNALECLRQHARQGFEVTVSINLINHFEEANEVLVEVRNALESEVQKHPWLNFSTNLDMLLRNIQVPDAVAVLLDSKLIRTYIREASFASEGSSWSTGSKASAIRCLARFDTQAAFLAAKTALHNVDWHDRDYYPHILIELDKDRAIPLLLEQLAVENDMPVVRAICGAMMVEGIDDTLPDFLHSSDIDSRKVGCLAAGWLSRTSQTEATLRELLGDPDDEVSRESADALSRIRRRDECRALAVAILEEKDGSQRWILLDCLLTMADPGDIHRPWPIEGPSIGDVLSPLQVNHVTDRLEKLR